MDIKQAYDNVNGEYIISSNLLSNKQLLVRDNKDRHIGPIEWRFGTMFSI